MNIDNLLPTLGEAGTESGGDWAQNIIDSLKALAAAINSQEVPVYYTPSGGWPSATSTPPLPTLLAGQYYKAVSQPYVDAPPPPFLRDTLTVPDSRDYWERLVLPVATP